MSPVPASVKLPAPITVNFPELAVEIAPLKVEICPLVSIVPPPAFSVRLRLLVIGASVRSVPPLKLIATVLAPKLLSLEMATVPH